jgi:hypothetical protein
MLSALHRPIALGRVLPAAALALALVGSAACSKDKPGPTENGNNGGTQARVEGTWRLASIEGLSLPVRFEDEDGYEYTLQGGELWVDDGEFELTLRIDGEDFSILEGDYDQDGREVSFVEESEGAEFEGRLSADGRTLSIDVGGEAWVFRK